MVKDSTDQQRHHLYHQDANKEDSTQHQLQLLSQYCYMETTVARYGGDYMFFLMLTKESMLITSRVKGACIARFRS